MATLQNTTVPDSGYYRVGTSTNKAYVSAGSYLGVQYAHFGNDAWWNSSAWQGSGEVIQISDTTISFYTSPTSGVNAFNVSSGTTTLASTVTTVLKTSGNTSTNSTLGVGAAAGTAVGDGKILVNAGGTGKPFLEVTNCAGSGGASPSTSTFSVFKGYLGIKIGSNVGSTAVTAGTYYIRLWNNA